MCLPMMGGQRKDNGGRISPAGGGLWKLPPEGEV